MILFFFLSQSEESPECSSTADTPKESDLALQSTWLQSSSTSLLNFSKSQSLWSEKTRRTESSQDTSSSVSRMMRNSLSSSNTLCSPTPVSFLPKNQAKPRRNKLNSHAKTA